MTELVEDGGLALGEGKNGVCEVIMELNVGSCIGGYGVNLFTSVAAVCGVNGFALWCSGALNSCGHCFPIPHAFWLKCGVSAKYRLGGVGCPGSNSDSTPSLTSGMLLSMPQLVLSAKCG